MSPRRWPTAYSFERSGKAAAGSIGRRFLSSDRSGQSAENAGIAFAKAAGAESLAELRALPVEKLLAVQSFRTQENVDGWVLPDEIRTLFAAKRHNNVPVIVGSNANEMTSLTGPGVAPKTLEDFKQRLAQQYGELATAFEAAYGVKGEADIVRATLASARDTIFSLHMRTWARATVATRIEGVPVLLFACAAPSTRAGLAGVSCGGDPLRVQRRAVNRSARGWLCVYRDRPSVGRDHVSILGELRRDGRSKW